VAEPPYLNLVASLELLGESLETFTMTLGAHGDEDVALIAAHPDPSAPCPRPGGR